MLAAVALAGADGRADDERNLCLGARHVVPLARLVRDLVRGHQREVHVHELDHRPEADDRGPDGRAADARLGDRRVEDAIPPERLEEPLRELERAAVVRDVLPVEENAAVAGHLLRERVADGIAVGDRPIGVALGRRHGLERHDPGTGRRDHVGGRLRVEVLQGVDRIRVGGQRGADGGACVARADLRLDGRDRRLVGDAGIDDLQLEALDRVDRPPGCLLLACPVLVARVGERVPVVAVRARLDEDRALAGAAQRNCAPDRVAHRQDVHPVDRLGVHVVLGEAGGAPGKVPDAHHLFVRVVGHPVVVVLDEVDDGEPVRVVAGQVVRPLRLGRPVERLEDHPVGVGAVPREAADHPVRVVVAVGHRGARGDRHAAAHDRVGAEVARREVADVHPAAATGAVARLLAEELGDDVVDVLLERRLQQLVARAAGRGRDAGAQLVVGHPADRRESLGDGVAVAAVRARDVVVDAEQAARSHGRCLLADRDVRRAAVLVARKGIVATRPQADDHLLQLANGEHVVEQLERPGAGDAAVGDLRRERARVREAGDGPGGLFEERRVRSMVAPICGRRCHGVLRFRAARPPWRVEPPLMP